MVYSLNMRRVILIADNLRSAHNVGSLLRTADGLGLECVYLTGYSPHPPVANDKRPPHERNRVLAQIDKTALGAEKSVKWFYSSSAADVIRQLKGGGYLVAALEQTADSIGFAELQIPERIALVVGNEVDGISPETLDVCDIAIEIPMKGSKESFNVAVAAAMALYQLVYSE